MHPDLFAVGTRSTSPRTRCSAVRSDEHRNVGSAVPRAGFGADCDRAAGAAAHNSASASNSGPAAGIISARATSLTVASSFRSGPPVAQRVAVCAAIGPLRRGSWPRVLTAGSPRRAWAGALRTLPLGHRPFCRAPACILPSPPPWRWGQALFRWPPRWGHPVHRKRVALSGYVPRERLPLRQH